MLAHVFTPSGETETMLLPEDHRGSIDRLKALVGDAIEAVPIAGARYLIFSANSKVGPHEVNQIATIMAHEAESIQRTDYLAGTVVLIPQSILNA